MPERALRRGDTVYIRGERWRVSAETTFPRSSVVDVDGCDATNANTRARFILPFDTPRLAHPTTQSPRVVSLRRWRSAARAVLADAVPHWGALRAAARARLTILPFQLEPALAMMRGEACRFLIADEVGLGKTIQAGLIIAETLTRIADARVLVVTPAGLREQWREELAARFDIAAELIDAGSLARASPQVAADVNPWAIHPVAITSIDFIKRPDVVRAVEPLTWDVVVFDEAHALAGRSDRASAADAIADRARVVVLLTATPHSGDDVAFGRLCALGDTGEAFPLRTFRRTRGEVGLPHGRSSVRIAVRLSQEERVMHAALDEYVGHLAAHGDATRGGPALVASILRRRACSSAFALAESLERRLALIGASPIDNREQLVLPFVDPDSDEEPGHELGGAWLPDAVDEAQWLSRLIASARAAQHGERKLVALRRLLGRITEPAIVFTEYRDTLHRVSRTLAAFDPLELHGGLTAHERSRALRRFSDGPARLLVATDAASEGLNLHHRCRLVVNLEIPWTPARLEQRIGRVDRLGQSRRVHAICLVASDTSESAMTTRFDARSERIAAAFAHPASLQHPLASEAIAEAERLTRARALATTPTQSALSGRPPVAVVTSHRSTRSSTWAFHLPFLNEEGEPVFETIAGVRDAAVRVVVTRGVSDGVAAHHVAMLPMVIASIEPWLALATRRERAIVATLRTRQARLSAALLQPGLFDRRTERAAAAQAQLAGSAIDRSNARLAWLDRLRHVHADERSIAFGIICR